MSEESCPLCDPSVVTIPGGAYGVCKRHWDELHKSQDIPGVDTTKEELRAIIETQHKIIEELRNRKNINTATAREAYAAGITHAKDLIKKDGRFVFENHNLELQAIEWAIAVLDLEVTEHGKPLVCSLAEPPYSPGRGQCMDVRTAAYRSHD